MHITALTLFPELFPGPLGASLTGRALEENKWSLETINIRDFGHGKHSAVDDTPYGGGPGMVMRADVVGPAIDAAKAAHPDAQLIYFSPRGQRITQEIIKKLTGLAPHPNPLPGERGREARVRGEPNDLILLCGRFEAIDERIIKHYQPLELSLGDFVMTGGEMAAYALIDACVRLLPGVVGDAESLGEESFGLAEDYACLLEYPHYSKPPIWNGLSVPEVLTSGDHGKIAEWRKAEAEAITKVRRPELLEKYKG